MNGAGLKINAAMFRLLGAAVFLVAVISTTPLSAVIALARLDDAGFSAFSVSGALWRGKLTGVAIGDARLGDVDLRIRPLSVLALRPQADIVVSGGEVIGRGKVSVSVNGTLQISGLKARVAAGAVTDQLIMGAAPTGEIELAVDRAAFNRKGCQHIEGVVATDMLNAASIRYAGGPFPVAGALACADGDLMVALKGEGAPGEADIGLRIRANRTFEVNAVARVDNEDLAAALVYFGFERDNDALVYGSAGVFEGAGS